MNKLNILKETIKYLESINDRIGDTITEYDCRETSSLLLELKELSSNKQITSILLANEIFKR